MLLQLPVSYSLVVTVIREQWEDKHLKKDGRCLFHCTVLAFS